MEVRPYHGQDEDALLAIWQSAMSHDPISASRFRTQVLLDPNFHPANLPVAIKNRRLVGFLLCLTRHIPFYAQGIEPDHAWITAFGVHSEFRRMGVGTALFDYIIDKLRSEERTILEISPYVPNYFVPGVDTAAYSDAILFLTQQFQFSLLYHAISMGVNLTHFQMPSDTYDQLQLREQDDRLTIRPIESADITELMPFLIDHFGWDWYRHAQSYLSEYFGNNPHQICFLVARLNGEVIGFCQQRGERFGPFGVHEDCRGRGIGKQLLFTCLNTMRAKNVHYAYFLWTDEKAARLYAKAGFERQREFAVLRKML